MMMKSIFMFFAKTCIPEKKMFNASELYELKPDFECKQFRPKDVNDFKKKIRIRPQRRQLDGLLLYNSHGRYDIVRVCINIRLSMQYRSRKE